MNKITSITRRVIISTLTNGFDEDIGFDVIHHAYNLFGVMNPVEFLSRLYPLRKLQSKDSRYDNAEDDICKHTVVNPEDYPIGWVFEDDRFSLKNGSDENLLNFLTEIFHPEVRDESQEWMPIYHRINELLCADGYEFYLKGQISKRNVYGWRDKTVARFHSIKEQDIKCFTGLLIKQGDVIDFYRRDEFDHFTYEAIGVRLCDRYGTTASKGSALRQFLNDCMDEGVVLKLLSALIARYESSPRNNENERVLKLYKRCKSILDGAYKTNAMSCDAVKNLQREFSNEYLTSEMNLMLKMQDENPTEAIGKAKELIESCCKTILEANGERVPNNCELSKLVSDTTKFLRITPEDIPEDIPMAATMKALLGNLRAIAKAIAELRNAYGSGHGRSVAYKGLQPRHAKLAVGSSLTLVRFLWDSFQRKKAKEIETA